jgi:hypothetical protein
MVASSGKCLSKYSRRLNCAAYWIGAEGANVLVGAGNGVSGVSELRCQRWLREEEYPSMWVAVLW